MTYKTQMCFDEALKLAKELVEKLKSLGFQIEVTGSILRKEKVIGDIDLIVIGSSGILKEICNKMNGEWEVKSGGSDRITTVYYGQQVNLFRTELDSLGAMKFYLTGPSNYVIGYRMKAKNLGFKLDQFGLWDGDKIIASKTEEEIYQKLGKSYKKPELRGRR